MKPKRGPLENLVHVGYGMYVNRWRVTGVLNARSTAGGAPAAGVRKGWRAAAAAGKVVDATASRPVRAIGVLDDGTWVLVAMPLGMLVRALDGSPDQTGWNWRLSPGRSAWRPGEAAAAMARRGVAARRASGALPLAPPAPGRTTGPERADPERLLPRKKGDEWI